jgi:signal transduction histidine kinase/CheY-like chemotaxis protein
MAPISGSPISDRLRRAGILAAEVRLLHANAALAFAVTVVAATILGRLQWNVVPNSRVRGWWLYMISVAVVRFIVARRYSRAPQERDLGGWRAAFVIGAGLSGAGWGAAGILLYPFDQLINQVFLIFVLGGMMLGAASLLASRPEAFLAFMIPTGLAPSVRLFLQGDRPHMAMGILAGLFTIATVITTWRIHLAIESSLRLQFENRDLVAELQAANRQAEALNQALERRVEERTAELFKSTLQLRAEIEQRQQAEEELLRVRKLESVGVLAGGIAHDFNNFLTVVQGGIEVISSRFNSGEVQEILDKMADACRRAAFLSSQLLTFAKGGAPVRRVVPVSDLVTDAVKLIRAGAAVSISVHLAKGLRSVVVDPNQMGQALHNILLNARQSMPEGGIIEVRAENAVLPGSPGDQWVRISIRDYGCGIPAHILPRIFDPYFTTKPGGTGLGLATTHAIITKHGGRISAESKPGEGTVFTLELPATDAPAAPETPVVGGSERGTERILVMDDEEPIRLLLKTILKTLGYEVETARDGAEAIALFERAIAAGTAFRAVLLDVTVPGGMGGVEAGIRLKEIDPSVKLIVSSGYSDARVMSDFGKFGFDDVLPKPWTATQISDVFRRVLVRTPNHRTR